MKFCPVCNSEYPADDDFCPVDGSQLALKQAGDPGRVVVSWDANPPDEVPTRYVPVPPQPGQAQAAPDNSKWLYALVGGLTAIVLMGGLYIFMTGQREKPPEGNGFQSSSSAVNTPGNKNTGDNRVQTSVDIGAVTNADVTTSNKPAPNTNTGPPSPLQRKFERSYAGDLYTNYIEMNLRRDSGSLSGEVVFSNGKRTYLRLDGNIENDGTFKMNELSDTGALTGIYRGKFNSDGSMVTGTWTDKWDETPRSFSLRRQ